jgi:transposase
MTPREAQLTAELARCKAELEACKRENVLLRQKVDLLVRRVFGSSSERLDPAQMQLLLLADEVVPAGQPSQPVEIASPEPATKTQRRERSPRLPENLPVVEEVIDPEPVKAEPQDWRCIGQEVSEQLDYEPGRFLRRRLIRRTYVHRKDLDLAPVTAPLPERLQDRCIAAPGLLAQVIVSKFCDHIPLYRQEQIFKSRYGVHLPRQTLDRWVDLTADWFKPIYHQIQAGVMAGGYFQVDETPIDYLDPGFGRTRQGYYWVCNKPGGDVVFHWEPSRATDCLDKIIPVDFTGTIQCDGYAAYRAFADRRANSIKLAACWAHARRKFHEALQECGRTGGWILRQIQHLYQIEEGLRTIDAGPNLRLAVRQHQSRPVVDRIGKALERLKSARHPLPQSLLGKAIDYTQNLWQGLQVFLDDGQIEIDNNLVENAIRPTAIGKKNWLFVGDKDAGERGAILYTIIESCRRQQIDPFAYLRDILARLPSMTNHQIADATPAAWAKAQSLPLKAAS